MIIKKEFFEQVYFVWNPEKVKKSDFDNFVMCSTKNWNYYFTDIKDVSKSKLDIEKIKNVELIEFNNKKSMFSFIKKLDDTLLLDFSLEGNFFSVLKFA
jgi:hypothetical protein